MVDNMKMTGASLGSSRPSLSNRKGAVVVVVVVVVVVSGGISNNHREGGEV